MIYLLPLLLPVAALSGWYWGRHSQSSGSANKNTRKLPSDYLVGLNYLINEQPDKAVDIFIKMLEVSGDTFETHLALGNLFRRRGEADRAIRIHQNLIALPQLNKQQRHLALAELGQDYFRAGVLDRAEKIFLQLLEGNEKQITHLQSLLYIYQQQKDWQQAIPVAQRLEKLTRISLRAETAHYYCELAEVAYAANNIESTQRYLQQALSSDSQCARASILQGNIAASQADYKNAIRSYKQVKQQDPEFISEIIAPLSRCHEQLNDQQGLIDYLEQCLQEFPRISVVLALAEYLRRLRGDKAAIEFIAQQIQLHPSLRGVGRLLDLYLANSQGDTKEKLLILRDLVSGLLADKPVYRCGECGFASKTLFWQCPRCRQWNSVRPIHGVEGD
jgi:lipopolysaccharide biosynthesis regulator YciM